MRLSSIAEVRYRPNGFSTTTRAPSAQRDFASPSATVANMLTLAQDGVNAVKAQPTIVTTTADVFAPFAHVAHPYGLTSCAPTG